MSHLGMSECWNSRGFTTTPSAPCLKTKKNTVHSNISHNGWENIEKTREFQHSDIPRCFRHYHTLRTFSQNKEKHRIFQHFQVRLEKQRKTPRIPTFRHSEMFSALPHPPHLLSKQRKYTVYSNISNYGWKKQRKTPRTRPMEENRRHTIFLRDPDGEGEIDVAQAR